MEQEKINRRKFIGAMLLSVLTVPAAAEAAKIGTLRLREDKADALGECSYGALCGGGGGGPVALSARGP